MAGALLRTLVKLLWVSSYLPASRVRLGLPISRPYRGTVGLRRSLVSAGSNLFLSAAYFHAPDRRFKWRREINVTVLLVRQMGDESVEKDDI